MTDQVSADLPEAPGDPFVLKLKDRFGERIHEVVTDADHPTLAVRPADLIETLTFLRDDPDLSYDRLSDLCGVDYLGLNRTPRFGVVYHLYSMARFQWVRVRVPVDEHDLVVPSIVHLWPAANYMEREAYDMYGIRFAGHPDLKRILTPDEWDVHPLRKDFAPPPEPIEFSFNPDQWQKAVQRGGS